MIRFILSFAFTYILLTILDWPPMPINKNEVELNYAEGLEFARDCEIIIDGKPGMIKDLREGMELKMQLDIFGRIKRCIATTPKVPEPKKKDIK